MDVNEGFVALAQFDVFQREVVQREVYRQVEVGQFFGRGAVVWCVGFVARWRQEDLCVAKVQRVDVHVAGEEVACAQVQAQFGGADVKSRAMEVQVLPALVAKEVAVECVVFEGVGGEAGDEVRQLAVAAVAAEQVVECARRDEDEDEGGEKQPFEGFVQAARQSCRGHRSSSAPMLMCSRTLSPYFLSKPCATSSLIGPTGDCQCTPAPAPILIFGSLM